MNRTATSFTPKGDVTNTSVAHTMSGSTASTFTRSGGAVTRLALCPSARILPGGGPVPCPPAVPLLCYAKHIGGGQIIFRTAHQAAPDPIADGWHTIALEVTPP